MPTCNEQQGTKPPRRRDRAEGDPVIFTEHYGQRRQWLMRAIKECLQRLWRRIR